jgi:hypothetical protein
LLSPCHLRRGLPRSTPCCLLYSPCERVTIAANLCCN